MALVRRNGVYEEVSGMTEPQPAIFSTGINALGGSFTGGNQLLRAEAPSRFQITSPLVDYQKFRTEYDLDTSSFGMLASWHGPNVRYSNTLNVKDIYPSSFMSFPGRVSVNVGIDYDLANKQQQVGTVAWYRNLYQNTANHPRYGDPETFNRATTTALDFLATRNVNFAKTYNATKTAAYYAKPVAFPQSVVSGPGVTTSRVYSMKSSLIPRYF